MTSLVPLQRGRAILQKKRAALVTNACGFPEGNNSEGAFLFRRILWHCCVSAESPEKGQCGIIVSQQLDFLRTCVSSKLPTEDLLNLSRTYLFRSVGRVWGRSTIVERALESKWPPSESSSRMMMAG